MVFRRRMTVLETIREAIVREVHFASVGPARGRPTVLTIEGPGALTGPAERAVVGQERALFRAGFKTVECLGVDPDDARGRPGRLRALVPPEGQPWRWERTGGEELQRRIMEAAESDPIPKPTQPPTPAPVLPLSSARHRRR